MMRDMAILTGNSNPELAKEIAEQLGIKLTDVLVGRFSEGEIRVQIKKISADAMCLSCSRPVLRPMII